MVTSSEPVYGGRRAEKFRIGSLLNSKTDRFKSIQAGASIKWRQLLEEWNAGLLEGVGFTGAPPLTGDKSGGKDNCWARQSILLSTGWYHGVNYSRPFLGRGVFL